MKNQNSKTLNQNSKTYFTLILGFSIIKLYFSTFNFFSDLIFNFKMFEIFQCFVYKYLLCTEVFIYFESFSYLFLNFPHGSPGCRFCQTWPFYITSKKNFNSVTLRQSSLTSASIIHWRISDMLLEFLLIKQANNTTSCQKNRGLII